VWGNASRIVVNSEGLRELAARTVPDRVIDVVPNGVDLERFNPADRRPNDNDKVRLLFVGRFVQQKGVQYLLQSIAKLREETLKKLEVELIGNGPEEEQLRTITGQLGLGNIVRFSGWVGRGEIADHYRAADIFVLPSFEEGMPNVVLEALGCGIPVVATDIYGNRELIRDGVNGILFPPADVEALTQALSSLIGDVELRRRMGKDGRDSARERDWSRVADRYLELTEDIIRRRSLLRAKLDTCKEG
jgi:glycosyltransferase involved in cell wall biosynthesis